MDNFQDMTSPASKESRSSSSLSPISMLEVPHSSDGVHPPSSTTITVSIPPKPKSKTSEGATPSSRQT